MGYRGTEFRMPLNDTGLRDDRNTQLLPPTSLLPPSCNVNYHEGGLSKRGGTEIQIAGNGKAGQGVFQFYLPSQQTMMFVSNGVLYQTNYSNVLQTGMSTNNPISFVQTSSDVFVADGASNPIYWSGSGGVSNVTPASSWTGNMPFQFVKHSLAGSGSGDRMWAVTPQGVWYSKLNTPTDFLNSDAGFIPIDSIGGLTGAYDLGGQLFAFSRTQTFFVQDQNSSISNWGYINAIWEGGVASWRLIVKANNNLYFMTEDGTIYNIIGVLTTGGYNAVPLDRPAFVDKFIRDNVNLGNIQNFHATYDRKLRCIKWFMQEGGSTNNIAVCYYIDKPPTSAWIIHNNTVYSSGYNAAASCEVRVTAGNYQVWTIDYNGAVWGLEQTSRDDNGNAYPVVIMTKPQDLNIPRRNKHWLAICFRGSASGTVNFTMYTFIEGIAQGSETFSIGGSGSAFNSAYFNTATFATDMLTFAPIMIGAYGRDLQIQLVEQEVGTDWFFAEIEYLVKPLEIKVYA